MQQWQTQRVFADREEADQLVKHLRVQRQRQRRQNQLYGADRQYRVKVLSTGQFAYQMRVKPAKAQVA